MKTSLGKQLLRFATLHKSDAKDKTDIFHSAQLDELAQASKDMQAMRNCYDSLLSAAAATANSAYEFSESLREMGTCLLEKTSLHGDDESGRMFLMLGKVQFELQKLVDSYRSHIFLTITNPSESLLNELRTVEEMKRQCDDKRDVYEYMITQQREKGKSKSGKGESFTMQDLQRAHDDFEEDTTLLNFRLKSLKQGQSRSLLTQAARHHAAQLNFFRKALNSLEAVDPLVRLVTEQQHIDYHFSGLEDDGEDGEEESIFDSKDKGELSFDYRKNLVGVDVSVSRNSMEVDDTASYPQASTTESSEVYVDKRQEVQALGREHRMGSHSAPIVADKKFDPVEKLRHIQQTSGRKSSSYVLPTPIDGKNAIPSRSSFSVHSRSSFSAPSRSSFSAPRTRPTSGSGGNQNLWHSSPLEQKKQEVKVVTDFRENKNNNNGLSQLPPPPTEGFASDIGKIKRQAFSGPLSNKPVSKKTDLSASGPILSSELPQLASGMLSRTAQPSSPKVSPSASPPPVSSPRISELHELPRPPGNPAIKTGKATGFVGYSGPLISRSQDVQGASKIPSVASPLPVPPLIVPRSFSIPSSSHRTMALHVDKTLESPQAPNKVEDIPSPPLTPISLVDVKPVNVAAVVSQAGPVRGGG